MAKLRSNASLDALAREATNRALRHRRRALDLFKARREAQAAGRLVEAQELRAAEDAVAMRFYEVVDLAQHLRRHAGLDPHPDLG